MGNYAHGSGKQDKIEYGLDFKVATLNMHSLRDTGKREELEMWAWENNIDLILIQETWINQCAVERRERKVHDMLQQR